MGCVGGTSSRLWPVGPGGGGPLAVTEIGDGPICMLDVVRWDFGILKSWTRVPLILGSLGFLSSRRFANGGGTTLAIDWLDFLRISSVDMGFLRNGKLFLAFGGLGAWAAAGTADSAPSPIPDCCFPLCFPTHAVASGIFWSSVGVTKEGACWPCRCCEAVCGALEG